MEPKAFGCNLLLLIILVVVLPVLPCIWPWLRYRRRRLITPRFLQRVPTDDAADKAFCLRTLSHGETLVRRDEPNHKDSDAPWIVLVHGNTTNSQVFDELTSLLVAAGRRVLRYDVYGRGNSACGGFDHNGRLFVSQLAELLFAERLQLPVDIVGYSIGSQIAAAFAATHAHAVRSVVLLCPAIVAHPAWFPTVMQIGVIRRLLGHIAIASLCDKATYASDWLHLKPGGDEAKRAASNERFARQYGVDLDRFLHEPALARSFGLSLCGMPFDEDTALWRRLGASGVHVHALCGLLDTIVPGEAAARFLEATLGDTLTSVQRLATHGHSLPYEEPDECAALLLACLPAQRV